MRRTNSTAYYLAAALALALIHGTAKAEPGKPIEAPATVVLEPVEEVAEAEGCASCEGGTPIKFRVWKGFCPHIVCSPPCKQPYLVHTCYTCKPSICQGWWKISAKSMFRKPLSCGKKAECAACYEQ